jgi:uroporphyrinogen-III synthase
MRVVVTRPQAQADALVAELQRLGIDAVALPLIEIAAVADATALRQAWDTLSRQALVMFVSANAVAHFFAQRPSPACWPPQTLAGSTGPGTSAALRQAGVPPPLLVEPAADVFDSEALWERLRDRPWSGRQVLVVRGEGGRDWLAERLGAAGATVRFVAAYERRPPRLDAAGQERLREALAEPLAHLWAVSSSEALGHLERLAPGADWSRSAAVAPHPRIVAALRRLGFGHVRLAAAGAEALAKALREGRPIQSAGT